MDKRNRRMRNIIIMCLFAAIAGLVLMPLGGTSPPTDDDTTADDADAWRYQHHFFFPSDDDDYDLDEWDPFREMERLQQRINRMFRSSFRRGFSDSGFDTGNRTFFFEPAIDVKETEDRYVIELDVPGMDKEQIEVKVHENIVTIKGTREVEKEERSEGDESGGQTWYRRERSFGTFQRTIPLPDDAKPEGITAHYDKGVLTVTVPKKPAATSPQKGRVIQVL